MRTWLQSVGALALALSCGLASADLLYTFDTDAQGVTATGAELIVSPGYLTLQDIDSADMAVHLPEGAAEVQRVIASYLGAKAGALALAGRAWLAGEMSAAAGAA